MQPRWSDMCTLVMYYFVFCPFIHRLRRRTATRPWLTWRESSTTTSPFDRRTLRSPPRSERAEGGPRSALRDRRSENPEPKTRLARRRSHRGDCCPLTREDLLFPVERRAESEPWKLIWVFNAHPGWSELQTEICGGTPRSRALVWLLSTQMKREYGAAEHAAVKPFLAFRLLYELFSRGLIRIKT